MTAHSIADVAGRVPARSRSRIRLLVAALATLALAAAGLATAIEARAAVPDYTRGVTSLTATQARIWFRPTSPAALVDVHYLISGIPQQNFRMANNGGTWEQTVSGLAMGTAVQYWFTYEKGGPLFDTGRFSYTHGGGGCGKNCGGGGPGTFPVTFQNNTKGRWANSQIHVLVLGMTSPGQWAYLKANGAMSPINHNEENAPNHLTKNGRNYANLSFTLAQATTVNIPQRVEGGRMYISVGSPMYIPISPDDRGWGGPDLQNPNDPNTDVYYDWYEFTYQHGVIPFGGNTTQVDQVGCPMTARLRQAAIGYDQTVGITLDRDQVLSQYAASVGPAFKGLANQYRIVAPRSSGTFKPGGARGNYLQAYIDQTWNYYVTRPFSLTRLGETFTGRVTGGVLTGTKSNGASFTLRKPTTTDVVECSGALASGGMDVTSLQMGAEFCAAFNRGVAMNTADWYNPAAYYKGGVKNDYAAFFHTVGIDHRAYGFAYDDINDQSSVKILPNANPPSSLTIGIGW